MVIPLTLAVKANGPMQAPSKTDGSAGQARSLLLSQVHLAPKFQMTNSPPTAWNQEVFKRQLDPATRRRRLKSFSSRGMHDKLLRLPR